ncbi:MAG TPA: class I SAM-dependent methyltransferase [Candidatus Binatia bacterium]
MRRKLRRSDYSKLVLLTLIAALLIAGCGRLKQFAYEGFNRDSWQQPDKVIAALNLHPGEIVADLGSGGGYFTFKLAKAVAPSGKVYAVDVDKDMIELISKRLKEESGNNVETILATPTDPRLPQTGVDLIFTVNTYHHIADRSAYFANARKYLRPGGKIAIIDLDRRAWLEGLLGHYTPSETIKREMEQSGYTLQQQLDFLDRQSFLIFSLKN